MRRALASAFLLVAAFGCGELDPSWRSTAMAAPDRSPLLLDGDLHGLTPTDDLVLWASRLGDPADRAKAAEELEALPAPQRVAILRTGIRLRDATAARLSAGLLDWKELDDWEQGLTTRLIADAVVDPAYQRATGDEPNFGRIFERCSGAELPYVFELVATHADTLDEAGNLSILHKSASAEHLPQLAQLSLSSNADVRRHALDIMQTVTIHTDQHREDVAAALLGLSIEEARRRHSDDGKGVPALLAAVLTLEKFPFDPNSDFRTWAWRWLGDTHPAPHDVEFLLQLDGAGRDDRIAWILRDVPDPRIDAWLASPSGPSDVWLGVLALRGDRDALVRLVERADEGSEALAALLAVAPQGGRAFVERRVLGPDDEVAAETLENLRNAWEKVPDWSPVTWDDAAFAGFDHAVLAAGLDGLRLARIGISVPGCRTRAIAEEAAARIMHERLRGAEDEVPLAISDGNIAAFLETGAPELFREILRDWAESAKGPTRNAAIETLAYLGDPSSGALLVAAVRANELKPQVQGVSDLDILARSASPEVLAYLRERAPDDFAAAVAYGVATGLPERVGLVDFCRDEEDDPFPAAARDEVRALLFAGKWKDAVAHALDAAPDRGSPHAGMASVGLVDDDRVRAYLHRLQEHRELRLYPWATAELAAMGNPVARAEYEHALRTGRYRWGDESRQIAFDDGLRALPFWMELMETNCCRFCAIRCFVFDHWFDHSFGTEGGSGVSTPVEEAKRFVARAGGRFVWSRIASNFQLGGSYVPAPR